MPGSLLARYVISPGILDCTEASAMIQLAEWDASTGVTGTAMAAISPQLPLRPPDSAAAGLHRRRRSSLLSETNLVLESPLSEGNNTCRNLIRSFPRVL